MDFLKNLFGKQEQEDPNAEINQIKKLISENEVEMQGPGDKRLNEYYQRLHLLNQQHPLMHLSIRWVINSIY